MREQYSKIIGAIVTFLIVLPLTSCNFGKEATVNIQYTNVYGDTYEETAVPAQAIIMFTDGISVKTHHQIINECGGKVLEYYPLLESYLVETALNKEMDFILKARNYNEVEEVQLNAILDPMAVNMHIMDVFNDEYVNDEKNNVCLSHGDYCYYAAKIAYPECPDCIVKKSYDFENISSFFNPPLSRRNQKKYLNDIFEKNDTNSLLLINMSYGIKLGHRERQLWNESDRYERKNWVNGYIDEISSLSKNLLKLSKHNPNFIVFKASGNNGCHIMDEVIFNNLENILTTKQIKLLKNHVLFVSAKDDDFAGIEDLPIDKTKLYAYYTDSPAQYCPYMTMVDISQLYVPGTSFAAPYMLGKAARLFDIKGYRPMYSTDGVGFTVEDMVNHIHKRTKQYAENIQQPGIYTDDDNSETYYYNKRYSFTGILRCDYEDLCETGYPECFYYIEIEPIDIQVDGVSETDEPLTNVNILQIDNNNSLLKTGQQITVCGDLTFHIAGCHIHTDAYLINCTMEAEE